MMEQSTKERCGCLFCQANRAHGSDRRFRFKHLFFGEVLMAGAVFCGGLHIGVQIASGTVLFMLVAQTLLTILMIVASRFAGRALQRASDHSAHLRRATEVVDKVLRDEVNMQVVEVKGAALN